MLKANFDYSLKNIPIPPRNSYLKTLIARTDDFIQRLRWKVFFFLKNNDNVEDETPLKPTYGFRTDKAAPPQKELFHFERELITAITSIKFSNHKNEFQQQLSQDIRKLNMSSNLFVPADKTNNIYEMDAKSYNKLLHDNVTTNYAKCNSEIESSINKQAAGIVKELEIENRVEQIAKKDAYVTLKDHKDNFQSKTKCRLINPMKSNIGKISKIILDEANTTIKVTKNLKQWTSTDDVIKWFDDLDNNKHLRFIQLDIVEFYPSISKKVFNDALKYASTIHTFSPIEKDALNNARLSLLHHDNAIWQKKTGLFDTTMGAFDGAEVAELIGLFLLCKFEKEFPHINFGLYRDDGLGVHTTLPGPEATRTTKKIAEFFKRHGFSITVCMNLTAVDFLDITLDLDSKKYWPFRKPNSSIQYINCKSNHPPHVIKQIPQNVNSRLSTISSNETLFDKAKPPYESALKASGHNVKLNFKKTLHAPKSNNRKRNIIWYNPPYNAAITTNFGRTFLSLISKHFPRTCKLYKILNRNTIKLSYCCTSNMGNIIKSHNNKILKATTKENEEPSCNCNKTNKPKCPLKGHCQATNIIYEATVNTSKQTVNYIGSTANTFKIRFTNHKASFKNINQRNCTQLSKFIWENGLNPTPDIEWKILSKCPSYLPGNKYCQLCLEEKMRIIFSFNRPTTLNTRSDMYGLCPHKKKFTLGRAR